MNNDNRPILFNSEIRKTFVKGVFQDIKGYFEMASNGMVSIIYEEFDIKIHEFGFKLKMSKNEKCSKQLFVEVSDALINTINYMFCGDESQYDVSISSYNDNIEIEFVSNW